MTPTIVIRRAAKDDLKHIFQIEEEDFAPMHYPLFVLRQFLDIAPNLFFVAVDEQNQLKGYCFGAIDDERKMGWVLALTVIKSAQRKGIGQRLTTEFIAAMKHKNIHTIQLTTTPDNIGAIMLYEKVGFKKAEEVSDYYLDGSPRVIMKLETE